ncbi:ser/thr phosphatase family protein (macronuclear) [Tetrahymena thermophila SB210]|uniref:Ser/thr phosphatase family protein n=1 Tax=Tetrahymena thermophila (strain SB210) TaxID=312017 RepID=Q24I79_TETTS|nr:ser/thr phosphatase family protein [Tetrahymena thermophila SB210]EAS07359.2 ser/thr phosphatase family protein [Tetrahymena thermophila SB210]|eukprot:XP_001027601.2 ser/thr phosphatase family protein [Tetrahymena thermophila SB210]
MNFKINYKLLFVCMSVLILIQGRLLEQNKCEPQGVKLSLGDNYGKQQFYKNYKQIQSNPHDYTITYFTELNCTLNYIIVYGSKGYELKITPNITIYRQEVDQSGDPKTLTRNQTFLIYVYEYQLNLEPSKFQTDSLISYSCFYSDKTSTKYEEKGQFQFFHHDRSKMSDKEFKLVWMADFDVNESLVPKYNKRRFGYDNLKIISKFINSGRDKFVSIIGGGDYAYDMNDDSGQRGANFLKETEFLFSSIPFTSVAGNHELWYNMSYYKSLFRNPGYQYTQSDYYSLSFGNLIMIGLNTNRFAVDQKKNFIGLEQPYFNQMLEWLNNTLSWANQNYRWIVVYSHQNIHCFEDLPKSSCYGRQDIVAPLEKLLVQYKVDIYLCGHIHAYERVHPLYQGKKQFEENDQCKGKNCQLYNSPKAPVYVIDGTSGTNHQFPQDSGYKGSEEFTVTSDASLGFSTITVKNNTHLLFEHYSSDSMKVFDSFYIHKPDNENDDTTNNNQLNEYIILSIAIIVLLIILLLIYLRRRQRLKQELKYSDQIALVQ